MTFSILKFQLAQRVNWEDNYIVDQYRQKNGLFNFDMKRLHRFINDEYRGVDKDTASENINRILK